MNTMHRSTLHFVTFFNEKYAFLQLQLHIVDP